MTDEIENRIASLPNYNQQHSIRVINAELFQDLSEPARAWLFQGNPDKYDIAGSLRGLKEVTWSINQCKDEIHEGDRVYFWQSGSEGGIVGVGDILDEPRVRPPLEAELRFAHDESFRNEHLSVLIRKEKFIEPPISREQIRAVSELTDHRIFKLAVETNYSLTETQAESIEKFWQDRLVGTGKSLPANRRDCGLIALAVIMEAVFASAGTSLGT
jgi:predicted RNA-binding protein with PUA-like domain